jgi:hypothetical protein
MTTMTTTTMTTTRRMMMNKHFYIYAFPRPTPHPPPSPLSGGGLQPAAAGAHFSARASKPSVLPPQGASCAAMASMHIPVHKSHTPRQ